MGKKIQNITDPQKLKQFSHNLAHFAIKNIPQLTQQYLGQLIYAGGDDVLAFFPIDKVLDAATEINSQFNSINSEDLTDKMKMSAGIVIAHYKEDLRYVLEEARKAEKIAKISGRNRFTLNLLRRSGAHEKVSCEWESTDKLNKLLKLFLDGKSDRWIYKFEQEIDALSAIPSSDKSDPYTKELTRLLKKSPDWDKDTETAFILDLLKKYEHNLKDFINLVKNISFLARGRDSR